MLLVGHSYDRAVVTAAGAVPEVTGIFHVNTFAPNRNKSGLDVLIGTDCGGLLDPLADADGPGPKTDIALPRFAFDTAFANGLPRHRQDAPFASQHPVTAAELTERLSSAPAWRVRPTCTAPAPTT